MTGEELIPIGRAALLLGRSVDTLRRWESEGIGPKPLRINGRRAYQLAEVLAYRDSDSAPSPNL